MVSTIRTECKKNVTYTREKKRERKKNEFDFTQVTRPLEETAFLFYVSECGDASNATH